MIYKWMSIVLDFVFFHLQFEQLQRATELEADALALDIPKFRLPVNVLLLKTSEQIPKFYRTDWKKRS